MVRGVKTDSKAAQKERADKLQKFEEKLTVVTEEEGFDTDSADPADVQVVEEEEVIRFTDTDKDGKTRVRDISIADFETLESEAITESAGETVATPEAAIEEAQTVVEGTQEAAATPTTPTPAETETAAILDGEKFVDVGRQADIMGMTDRDGTSFSYSGEGPSTFLNEYSELQVEAVELEAERALALDNGNVEVADKVVKPLAQRAAKLTDMEKVIRTPQFQASLKANPDLQKQLEDTNLKAASRKAGLESFASGPLPEGVPRMTEFRTLSPRRFETIDNVREERLPPNTSGSPKEDTAANNIATEAGGGGSRKGLDPDAKGSDVKGNSSQAMLNRVNVYMKFMSSNKRLADRYPELRPIYNTVKKYNEEWFSIITRGLEGRTVAMALPSEKRKSYRIARTLADDMGIRIQFSGVSDVAGATTATIQIPGDTFEQRQDYVRTVSPYANPYVTQLGHLDVNNYIADGQQTFEEGAITTNNGVITITDQAVVNALQQEQDTTDSMWDDVITTKIFRVKEELRQQKIEQQGREVDFNYDNTIESTENSILEERGQAREELTIPEENELFLQALRKLADTPNIKDNEAFQQVKEIITTSIDTLEALTDGRRMGYFPRVRNGDVIIRVYKEVPEVGSDGEVRMVERVVYRRDVHTPLWRDKAGYARKKYEGDLRNFYNEGERITFSLKNNENASLIDDRAGELDNMTILESILIHEASLNEEYTGKKVLLENDEGKEINPAEYIRMLGAQYKKRKESAGFGRYRQHRKNVPGYITPDNEKTYHDNAWAQYVTSLGRFVAKTRTNAEAKSAIDNLKAGSRNLETGRLLSATPAEVAEKMWENTISPQGAASALKSFAFYGFLGGNFSSSFLNLTQNFVTASLLYGAYGRLFQPKVSKATAAAGRLAIYYIKNNNAFLKKDREPVAKILVKYGAARNLDEARDQFDKLYILQERGSIGRINTQALSSNADITTDYWYDKLGLQLPDEIAAKNLNPKQIENFKKFFKGSKTIVDGVYSSTEITNRIAAALATYNTVKASPEGMGPLREFARNTASGVDVANQDANRMVEIEDGMQYIIDESQFNLSAFNRPRLAFAGGGLGAVAIQFIPFVTMMIEVYANAITRYGGAEYGTFRAGIVNLTPQGRRTLAFLVLPQIILGGMFGLPFADDMKEVIKAIVRSPVGKSLGLQQSDMELAFYDIMTNTFGPEAMSFAEAIARGPIKAWGGVDIAQRVSLSPFRSLIEGATGEASSVSLLTGPAGAFFGQALNKSFDAFTRGDYGKSLLRLMPLAMTQNIINAVEAGEEGVYTGKGRPLADGLGAHDLLLMTLGFSSENVYGPRNRLYIEKALATKSNAIKDKYLDKIVRLMVQIKNEDSSAGKSELQQEINKLYEEVRNHDREQKNIWDKIDPNRNIKRTAVTRYKNQVMDIGRRRGGKELRAIRKELDLFRYDDKQ